MKYIILLFIVIGSASYADSSSLNLQLPGIPGNYQSDRFRAGDLDCSNAIGSATNLEFGVTGIIDKDYDDPISGFNQDTKTDVGVYARITIPLGKKPKSRVDCNRLFELELRKKQLEVRKLEQELEQLRKLQFEN
mgnify:CR=1 FL=1|jgi:hypothetical protein